MGSRRGSFPKVHSFVLAMLVADEDETTTADAGVVRTDDANAKDCADQCIDCITLDVCQSCEYQDNFTWGDLHPLLADLVAPLPVRPSSAAQSAEICWQRV